MSGKYLYTGKLSFFESVNFLIPSLDPFLFKSLTPFRCVHVADTLARSFPIPLPVQGEGKRAWRARVRAASTQWLTSIQAAHIADSSAPSAFGCASVPLPVQGEG
jgi:hypothetical protein